MRIVIVEDEVRIREGFFKLLGKLGDEYEIVGEAENGRQGLEVCRGKKPDLVITDVQMPEMDGLQMLQAISDEGLDIKAIVLSAYSEFEYARTAMKLGVTEYLLKKINVGPNSIYESGHLYLDSLKNNKNEFEAFNVDAHSRGNKEDDEKDIPDVSLYLISRKKELYSLLNNYIISFISKESNTKKIFENDIMIIRLENILSDRDLFKSFCELIYKEYQKNFREIIRIFQKLFEKLFSTYLEHTMIFINAIIKITPVQ